jgi:hypothetical protein
VLVSDAERDHAVARLGDAAVAGRLTVDELEARIAAALRARTRRELGRTQRGLPGDRPLLRLSIRIVVLVVTVVWLLTVLVICVVALVVRKLRAQHRPPVRHPVHRA